MRIQLKDLGSRDRHTFIATFERYGKKPGWFTPGNTALFKNVKLTDSEEILTDHIWLTVGKQLFELGELKQGDIIQFNARVGEYFHKFFDKDYMFEPEYSLDFRLYRANKLVVLNREVKTRKLAKNTDITDRQNALIKSIEEVLTVKFNGQTKSEASNFIGKHIKEFKIQNPKIKETQNHA